jgi:hypothetical protein
MKIKPQLKILLMMAVFALLFELFVVLHTSLTYGGNNKIVKAIPFQARRVPGG